MIKYFNINQKGFSIRCKLYCDNPRTIQEIIIFCHGFSGFKDNKFAEKIAERSQKKHRERALLIFDLPCHGDDARNKLLLKDCLVYLDIVVHYARENFKAQQLYGCGTSFGGYLLLKYIAENDNPFTKIALRCPAVNMYETTTNALMVTENLKTIQKGKPVLLGFDRKVKVTKDFIDDLKKSDITQNNYHSYSDNMLIVQGNKDEVVSYEVVKTFAENNGIPLETVQNADHRFSDPKKADTAISLIISFLN